ncbi:MAG TPA: biosynthetic peptidoglycan transglycosylase, partial [Acidimicrobiales bacterium]|nr:biosynthetic peptidoglycan transglycosylase [Acidimicrobiales bacterium]
MPWPLRMLAVLLIAGAGLALGMGLLLPEARSILHAGKVGDEQNLVQLEELSERSVVYAKDGSVLAVLHAEENRQPVPLSEVPTHVSNAIIDVEDDRFWIHNGVDIRSTIRALRTNVNTGGVRQGGSTITQQLVK